MSEEIICTLNVSVVPVRMGNEKRKKPLSTTLIALGSINPKDAKQIIDDLFIEHYYRVRKT